MSLRHPFVWEAQARRVVWEVQAARRDVLDEEWSRPRGLA